MGSKNASFVLCSPPQLLLSLGYQVLVLQLLTMGFLVTRDLKRLAQANKAAHHPFQRKQTIANLYEKDDYAGINGFNNPLIQWFADSAIHLSLLVQLSANVGPDLGTEWSCY